MGAMRYGHAKRGFLFRRRGWILVVVCKAASTAVTDDGRAVRQQAGKRSLGRDAVGLYAACANDGVSLRGCERFGWRNVAVIWVRYAYGLHDGISFVVDGGADCTTVFGFHKLD